MASGTTLTVLYFLQGEHGENEQAPNAFLLARTSAGQGKSIKFGEFLSAFPLTAQGPFAFRFRSADKRFGYVWEDIRDPQQVIPEFENVILAKVLRISALTSQPQLIRLRRKLPAQFKQTTFVPASTPAPSPATAPTPAPTRSPAKPATVKQSASANASLPAAEAKPQSTPPPAQTVPKQRSASLLSFDEEVPQPSLNNTSMPMGMGMNNTSAPMGMNNTSMPMAHIPTTTPGTMGGSSDNPDIDDDTMAGESVRDRALRKRAEEIAKAAEAGLSNKRTNDMQTDQLQREMDEAKQRLGARLMLWAEDNGKKRNIRTLLTTMHDVLWPSAKWKPLSLGDVLDPAKVKLSYRKAMLVVHPDRNSGPSVPAEQQFTGKRIFEAINEAYTTFLQHESPN